MNPYGPKVGLAHLGLDLGLWPRVPFGPGPNLGLGPFGPGPDLGLGTIWTGPDVSQGPSRPDWDLGNPFSKKYKCRHQIAIDFDKV